jgi:hypothetical protein
MPYNDPDPADPNILVSVELESEADTIKEMAYVFAEEFARIGFDREKILRVFRHPFYAGAHRAWRELGAKRIEEIVDECLVVRARKSSGLLE